MTILKRDTIVDRPELVNREDDEDDKDEEDQNLETKVIGRGGGPTFNGLEFEEGDLDVVTAANACAVLGTGEDEGQAYQQVFKNAAIQIKDMKMNNRDIELLSHFGLNNGIGTVGLDDTQRDQVLTDLMQSEDVGVAGTEPVEDNTQEDSDESSVTIDSDNEDGEDNSTDIDDVQEKVDEMSEDKEEEDGE